MQYRDGTRGDLSHCTISTALPLCFALLCFLFKNKYMHGKTLLLGEESAHPSVRRDHSWQCSYHCIWCHRRNLSQLLQGKSFPNMCLSSPFSILLLQKSQSTFSCSTSLISCTYRTSVHVSRDTLANAYTLHPALSHIRFLATSAAVQQGICKIHGYQIVGQRKLMLCM